MNQENHNYVCFFIPPVDERFTFYLRPFFEKKGYTLILFQYAYTENYELEVDNYFEGIEDSVTVIYPEELISICDRWAIDRYHKKRGNVKNVQSYLYFKGIKSINYPMDWGGPFDDALTTYGDDQQTVDQIIRKIESINQTKK